MRQDADALQDMLEAGDKWPLPQEQAIQSQLMEWSAFAQSDEVVLKSISGWQSGENQHLPYVIDPLPERIKDAFADLIFGAETDFEAADENDQELLDDIVEENDLPSELQDAAAKCVAEGEVWWRVYVDRDAFEHPVIEWHSRADVVPLWRGRKLLAAAFISDVDNLAPDAPVVRVGDDADPSGQTAWLQRPSSSGESDVRWRYVEIQTGGLVRNLLYQGTKTSLGMRMELSAREEFADLRDEWEHGLTVQTRAGRAVDVMLAGRVANGKAGRLGRSQYAGVKHLLYELNKLASVGGRNVELTMQKRAVFSTEVVQAIRASHSDPDDPDATRTPTIPIPDAFMQPRESMGETNPMGILEFSDAWAEALLAWDGGLTDKILTRCRVAPQLVGRHTEDAATGPALRARLMDSVLAADGKARPWDDALPTRLLRSVQLVDALSEAEGGCGHDWHKPDEAPVVVRSSVLPEDESEEVTRHAEAVGARLEARRTAIERLNQDWDEERVDEELALIEKDTPPEPVIPGKPPPPKMGVTAAGGNGAGR